LVNNFKILDFLLENLAVVIMPLGYLNIKEVIAKVLDVLEILLKDSFKLLETLLDFWALGASEDGHADLRALAGELKLALTNLLKVLASLDEGLVFSENGLIGIKTPSLSRRVLLDKTLHLKAYSLPLLAAGNGFIEITHALLDIAIKHVIFIYLRTASLNDLIGYLSE
jgi:hypothetical protein